MKKIIGVLLIALVLMLTACGKSGDVETKDAVLDESIPLEIAIVSGTSTTDVFSIAKEVLEKQGYTVKESVYTDFNSPNMAVADKSLDFNFYQHEPFLKAYNESNGTDLVTVGGGVYKIAYGVFSDKLKSIEEVSEGMTVAIQNDNSNRRISLGMLEKAGLIKLREGVEMPMLSDIVENPKNLKFIELEETLIASAMSDVDLGCISCSQWKAKGGDPETALLSDLDDDSTLYLVTRKGLEDSETAKVIQSALTSPEVKSYLGDKYKGVGVPTF